MDYFIFEAFYQVARRTNEPLHIVPRIAMPGKNPFFVLGKIIY